MANKNISYFACKACLAMCFACMRALVGTVVSVTVLELSVLSPYHESQIGYVPLLSRVSYVTSQLCVPFEASVG
jgi:hypothetical protein